MRTVKRSAAAVAALAVLLTACGGSDGDTTITNDSGDGTTTGPAQPPTLSPEPTAPGASPTPQPDESAEPREAPTQPPDDETEPSPDPSEAESAGGSEAELTVELDPGNGEVSEWTITCEDPDPLGDPTAECARLGTISPEDVAPVPKDAACTMQYGGPQTARITGLWDGEKVDLSFSRQNGCEIDRWNTMAPILPASDAALP